MPAVMEVENDPRYQWLGLDVLAENIPQSLQHQEQWVLWQAKHNGARVEKIPMRVYGDGAASSTDPSTWADFDGVIGAYAEGEHSGIGFVLREGGGICGLDFDHCRDPHTGKIDDDIFTAVLDLNSYAEVSPSGTGLRVIVRADAIPGAIKGRRLELYSKGRYLTMTGHKLSSAPEDVRKVSPETLIRVRDQFIPKPKDKPPTDGQYDGSCDVNDLVAGIISADNLHDALVRLAAHFAQQGMGDRSISDTLAGIMSQSQARTSEPDRWAERMKEIPRIVRSALEKFSPEAVKEAQQQAYQEESKEAENLWSKPLDIDTMLNTEVPKIDWVVQERLQAGRGVILSGIGGSSKSRLLYHLAAGITTGAVPWGWEIAKQGRAVLVLTEDTAEDVHRALAYTTKGMASEDREAIAKGIIIYALAGNSIKLIGKYEGKLAPTPIAEQLEARINALGDVRLVAIDPALGITEGDEMDQSDQHTLGKYVDGLAVRTGAAVVLVTHATKGSLQQDELSSHGSRGAGAITDAVRGEFQMRTMTPQEAQKAGITDLEERKRHVQLVATKGNHLPAAAYVPVWLRRDDVGSLALADVTLGEMGDSGPLTDKHFLALEALRDMCANHVPTLGEWRDKCEAREIIDPAATSGAKAKRMQRIKNDLFQAGMIQPGMGRNTWIPSDPN